MGASAGRRKAISLREHCGLRGDRPRSGAARRTRRHRHATGRHRTREPNARSADRQRVAQKQKPHDEGEQSMSKIERLASEPDLGSRVLRNDELEAVTGGIMIIGGLGGPDTRGQHYKEWIELELPSYSHG